MARNWAFTATVAPKRTGTWSSSSRSLRHALAVAPDPAFEPLRIWLRQQPDVAAAWLFGSRARADHRPNSDFDLAIHDGKLLANNKPAMRVEYCVAATHRAEEARHLRSIAETCRRARLLGTSGGMA